MTEEEKTFGYLRNCWLDPRDEAPMFTGDDDGRIIATLDGYAIIPMEKYQLLVQSMEAK